jgi:hypothetical protein
MFKDLFDFGKTRTLTESVGFYIFYAVIGLGLTTLFSLVGQN